MKQSFLSELKNLQTVTIKDLESQISAGSRQRYGNKNPASVERSPSDLKIISPFYQRIIHKINCKCKYHQKPERVIPKIKKVRTEADQPALPNIRATMPVQEQPDEEEPEGMSHRFEDWMEKLTSEELKEYYFDYLKSRPNFSKFKRMDKLDCHNVAFEQFLKNNYLVILERNLEKDKKEIKEKEKEVSVKHFKSSQRIQHKVFTEGNIDFDALSDCNYRKEVLSYKDNNLRSFESETPNDEPSKEPMKIKKIGIRGTGKTLELIDEEEIRSRKEDNRRKKAQFMNGRPSFFGLIEDQELLKELCIKLMHENKRANKEAEVIVKQLVESDLDMYQKMIVDLEEDLETGIKLRNLNEDEANILIKIVLNKIHRQTQMLKVKDQSYERKNSLIGQLCNKYGWPKQDQIVELKQFWKMKQEKLNSNSYSRKSLRNVRQSRSKISRNNIESKQNKKIKSKVKIKDEKRMSKLARMSGFHNEKPKNVNQNSVKFMMAEKSEEELIPPQQQSYKFIPPKPLSKMGVFKSKEKKNPLQNPMLEPEFKSNINVKRTFGTSHRPFIIKDEINEQLQEIDDVVIEMQTFKQLQSLHDLSLDTRNSSLYLNLKSQVQRHIEINKRFLKRIEHNLIDNQCQRLIIGMGEGILTKKRKIRAIYEALETEEIKKSDYYTDILKYLEIYEDYCDLVIRNKKEKKAREQITAKQMGEEIEMRKEEDEMDICMLLDDLKNERELKYISISMLSEEEDPREELILKIPQYTTKMQKKQKMKKPTTHHESSSDSESQPIDFLGKQQCGILQKDLEACVTVECRNNWNIQDQQQQQRQSPYRQKTIDLQNKLSHYRTLFKKNSQSK